MLGEIASSSRRIAQQEQEDPVREQLLETMQPKRSERREPKLSSERIGLTR
jgi:hypothetical protein